MTNQRKKNMQALPLINDHATTKMRYICWPLVDNPGKRNETRKFTKFVVAFGDTALPGKLFMHFNAKNRQ